MPQPAQFRRIAERYIDAADAMRGTVPEASAFASCHAFESIGAAWIRHGGCEVSRNHQAKLNRFVVLSRPTPFGRGAAFFATLTQALRNKMLYPSADGRGGYLVPEDHIDSRQASDLSKRIRGFITVVSQHL